MDNRSLGILLELSFYAYLLVIVTGIILLVSFVRWLTGEKDPLAVFPHKKTPEFKTFRQLLKLRKISESQSNTKELEELFQLTEKYRERFKHEQQEYDKWCHHREMLWHQMHQLFESLPWWRKLAGRSKCRDYQELLKKYQWVETKIEDEIRHLEVVDDMSFNELKHSAEG
ncbi:MAG: hypothetical protein HQM12_07385 [SAR324 cluster bacterium]|nr:hypothetical protein [SAR324 cluster bacterium]